MALGDIQVHTEGAFGYPGDDAFCVGPSATLINAGEPVAKSLGNTAGSYVTPAATDTPVVGTNNYAGIASTTSTNTSSAPGSVRVTKLLPGLTYLIKPNVAATFATQALYDALVGARVLIDLTSGSYTILASDSVNNGCVIMPLSVSKYPGLVRFAFRNAVSYLA